MNKDQLLEELNAIELDLCRSRRVLKLLPQELIDKINAAGYMTTGLRQGFIARLPWNAEMVDNILLELLELGFEIVDDSYQKEYAIRYWRLNLIAGDKYNYDLTIAMCATDAGSVCQVIETEPVMVKTYQVHCQEDI